MYMIPSPSVILFSPKERRLIENMYPRDSSRGFVKVKINIKKRKKRARARM